MTAFKVRYSYLPEQFADPSAILRDLANLVRSGDFTLGKPVDTFEKRFAELIGTRHAIGVGSGTDAIKLSLKALGIGHGCEVITAANTFIATVGAIAELGAKPVLVDCDDSFCLDPTQLEKSITAATKAIVPVHLTGEPARMPEIAAIAAKHDLPIVEDACQGILAEIDGRRAGTFGIAGAFSLHPLKNLNVWGDGGVIVTNDNKMAKQLRLLRNHGLRNRDEVEILGCNSRLDSVQAMVGCHLVSETPNVTEARIRNGALYDRLLSDISGIRVPPRPANSKRVFHLYMVFAERRDELFDHCLKMGVEAKIHYPVPLYRQDGLRCLGYADGDFPVTDAHAASVISFPVDQYVTEEQIGYVAEVVRGFYAS